MENLQNIFTWLLLNIKVALFNLRVQCNYKKVRPCHYRQFVKHYRGLELICRNPYENIFYINQKGIKVAIWIGDGLLRVRKWG